MTEPTILICDDDKYLREMVAEYLGTLGFVIVQAHDAADLHKRLEMIRPDLVLLDIHIPVEDGLTALRHLRAKHRIPTIMLSATAGTIDRIVGLELGADDYLGKPIDLSELAARIRAVLRRQEGRPSGAGLARKKRDVPDHEVAFGKCILDVKGACLIGEDGQQIPITAMEFSLLQLLALNAGRVLRRDQMLAHIHEGRNDPCDRSIDLAISRLRRKIEAHSAKPEVIRTVRGLGCIFDG